MLQFLEIIPEINYIPSGERWEYKEIQSDSHESEIYFLNRVGAEGWECIKVKYNGIPRDKFILNDTYTGIFKRKLIAI